MFRSVLVGTYIASPLASLSRTNGPRCLGQVSASVRMSENEEGVFPVLQHIAGGVWKGTMRYAGSSLEPAPFVLHGSTKCLLSGRSCTLESSVTFPNGNMRTVTMRGAQTGVAGSVFRLDPVDNTGPIFMRLAELAPDTVLLQEFSKADERMVLTASISLVDDGAVCKKTYTNVCLFFLARTKGIQRRKDA
jgi:hypothetical protein